MRDYYWIPTSAYRSIKDQREVAHMNDSFQPNADGTKLWFHVTAGTVLGRAFTGAVRVTDPKAERRKVDWTGRNSDTNIEEMIDITGKDPREDRLTQREMGQWLDTRTEIARDVQNDFLEKAGYERTR